MGHGSDKSVQEFGRVIGSIKTKDFHIFGPPFPPQNFPTEVSHNHLKREYINEYLLEHCLSYQKLRSIPECPQREGLRMFFSLSVSEKWNSIQHFQIMM